MAEPKVRTVPGYRVKELLYASGASVVFRARREADGLDVVIKSLRDELPTHEAIEGLRREHRILESLRLPQVAVAVALESVGAGVALVMKDTGGVAASELARSEGFGLAAFLRLALAATQAVEAIHRAGILHKDLKPAHLLVEADGAVRLIDFGLATPVGEAPEAVDPDQLEGTLAYLAPEQTGRMSRGVDRRSDLYALGVTLFELWTGQLPFSTVDPLELVHCHLAKTPPRADEVKPGSDPTVASILARLLAKVPEERYQTAAGLRADLSRCLAELERGGAIAPFTLGAADVSETLRLPDHLYGREAPLAVLAAAVAEVREGATRLVLLGGPSGVGKSSLIEALRKTLVGRALFGSGKFDQLRGGRPYPALSDACRAMTRQLLREPETSLARRRDQLREVLGNNAGVVAELVPELALVIGAAPPVAQLGPIEAQNRFEEAFGRFLAALASPQVPLAFFLDDLQWADPASLRLLRRVLTAPGHPPVLLLGAYRDNEVSGDHPLWLELEEVKRASPSVLRHLALGPLGPDEVARFTAEALGRPQSEVAPLAALLHQKTGGNPFHLGQFLLALAHQGLLHLDPSDGRWAWDLEGIDGLRATENVVDLLLERIRTLPPAAQRVLSVGACVGQAFDPATVAAAAQLEPEALTRGLEAAIRAGMLSLGASEAAAPQVAVPRVRFIHDRVAEAAAALLSPPERQRVHLALGRALHRRLGPQPTDDALFAVAQHLNRAIELLDPEERLALAELDLRCARRAAATAAAITALEHLAVTLELLGPRGWTLHPRLALAAHLAQAESECLAGRHRDALAELDEVDRHVEAILDRVATGNLRTLVFTNLGEFPSAIRSSLATLTALGVAPPAPDDGPAIEQAIGAEFGGLQAELGGRGTDALRGLPELTDPHRLAELATLAGVIPAAYQANQPLMVLIVLKSARHCLTHGVGDVTPFLLAVYALAHLAITRDHRAAFRWGRAALELAESRADKRSLGPVHFIFGGFISLWCAPFAQSHAHFRLGLTACLEAGDRLHAAYCVGLGAQYRLDTGRPLKELRAALPGEIQTVERLGDVTNRAYLTLVERFVTAMEGGSSSLGSFDGDGFLEAEFEARVPAIIRTWSHELRGILRFHAGDYPAALALSSSVEESAGLAVVIHARLFQGLAHAALARHAEGEARAAHLAGLNEMVTLFRGWAELCPENQAHHLALLEAEAAALAGDSVVALSRYDAAIDRALEQSHWHAHALACELAGEFHLREHRHRLAKAYLGDALRAYEYYGAPVKVTQLVTRHAELGLAPATEAGGGGRHPASSTIGRSAGLALDLESAMRATRAITSELESDRLVDRLLSIVMENAGAQRGALLVPRHGVLLLEADRTVEPQRVRLGLALPLSEAPELPAELLRYVARAQETVVSGGPASRRG